MKNPTINIFCACEGIPAIFNFNLSAATHPLPMGNVPVRVFALAGNALDVVLHSGKLLVSIDNVHEPASIQDVRNTVVEVPRFQTFEYVESNGNAAREPRLLEEAINGNEGLEISIGGDNDDDVKNLRSLVYGVENLRKRGNEEA